MFTLLAAILLARACESPNATCTCLPPPDPRTEAEARQYIERADLVVQGTVVRITPPLSLQAAVEKRPGWDEVRVTFVVRQRWRGAAADTVTFIEPRLSAGWCGVEFELGKSYFILAHAVEADSSAASRRFVAWGCGQSRPAGQARRVRRLLGPSRRRDV